MKRTLLWSWLLVSVCSLQAQYFDYQKIRNNQPDQIRLRSGEIFIADSVRCFQYNEALNDVVPQLREYALENNDQGEVTRKLVEYWDVTALEYLQREMILRNFNSNGDLIEEIKQIVSDGSDDFVNSTRVSYILNGAANPNETIHEEWDGEKWRLQSRELYEYQAGVRPTLFTFQLYENDAWQNQFRSFTNYDEMGKEASTLFQTWNDGVWLNGNRTFLEYDSTGQLAQTNREFWDVMAEEWLLSSREVQVYQFGQNTETRDELYQDFTESWLPQQRALKFYDEAGNLFQVTRQTYFNDDWVNVFKNISIYDENGNLIRAVGELWVEDDWRTQNSCDFYYSLFVTNVQDVLTTQLDCTYANPFLTGSSFDCMGLVEMQTAQLRIFNTQGQQIHYQDITNADNFNINKKMPTGLYQIVIQTERGIVFSEKIFVTQ